MKSETPEVAIYRLICDEDSCELNASYVVADNRVRVGIFCRDHAMAMMLNRQRENEIRTLGGDES